MAVKRSRSALRVFSVVELIAARQPISVTALARLLDEDKSAVQRAVMTLSDAGWIRLAPERPIRWELTAHIFAIAHLPDSSNDLCRRARPTLEALRDETDETVFLAIPDVRRFIVIDVAESVQPLRMAVRIGQVISAHESATARAMLAYLGREQQTSILGTEPDPAGIAQFAATRKRGYGLSVDGVVQGLTNLATPIFDGRGQPIAAIAVSGPSERLAAERHAGIGGLLVEKARLLSRGRPAVLASGPAPEAP